MRRAHMRGGAARARPSWHGHRLGITVSRARRWWQTLGHRAGRDDSRPLPGDDVVTDPVASETRGITIDAPPEARLAVARPDGLRPGGLVQLRPARPARQERRRDRRGLAGAQGRRHHADPSGRRLRGRRRRAGPLARPALRHGARDRPGAEAAAKAAAGEPSPTSRRDGPGRPAASGAILGATPQQFAASWAFVLEPIGGGRTRLIERFRVWFGESGFGVARRHAGRRVRRVRDAAAPDGRASRPAPSVALGRGHGSPAHDRPRRRDRHGRADGARRRTDVTSTPKSRNSWRRPSADGPREPRGSLDGGRMP